MRRKVRLKLNYKGVTLVELIIYLGLSMVMMVVLSELFVSILHENVEAQNYSAVQTDARYVLNRLKSQINNASSVTTPADLGETSGELVLVVDGVTYTYYLDPVTHHIYMNDNLGLISQPDTLISSLSFTRTGNAGGRPVILIEFTSTSGEPGTAQYESGTFKGAGGLRYETL